MKRKLLRAVKAAAICLAVFGAADASTLVAQTLADEVQPAVATCTTGTVDVDIPCLSAPGNSSGSFWIPYLAYPAAGKKGARSGLFLIASNEITTSPAPKWITTKPVQIVGTAYAYGSAVSDFEPALLMYTSAGANGDTHVYGLNLGDTSSVPKPVQIGTFSISPAKAIICGSDFAQENLNNPASLFVVLGVGTPGTEGGGCFSTVQQVVHFSDSPSTPPEIPLLPTYAFDPLYHDGVFKGAVAHGLLSGQIYLYSAQLKSKPLMEGSYELPVLTATLKDGTEFGDYVVYFEAIDSTSSSAGLYRIDSKSLVPSKVASFSSATFWTGDAIADGANLYYFANSAASRNFYQVPLTGGTPKLLYTGSVGANSAYYWIGATGSTLIFQYATVPETDGGQNFVEATASVYSIPVGKRTTSATRIGGPYNGTVSGFWDEASPTAKPNVYLNILHPLSTATNAAYKFSSVKVPLAGPYNQKPVANSAYGGNLVINNTPAVWQVTGINDPRGWGGGSVDLIDLPAGTSTKLTTTGGKNFTTPAGRLGLFADFINGNIAIGDFYPIASAPPQIGAAADLAHHFIYTVAIANTNVSLY